MAKTRATDKTEGGDAGMFYMSFNWGGVLGVMWRVCVCKYAAPWDTPRATSHQPPQRRIRPSAHLSHQSHLEEQHGGALHPSV